MKIKLLAIFLVLLMLTACSAQTQTTTEATQEVSQSEQEESQGEASLPQADTQGSAEIAGSTGSPSTEGTMENESASQGQPSSQQQSSVPSEGTEITEQITSQPSDADITEQSTAPTEPTVTKIYEHYLASLALYALVFEYPDFQIEGIYAASIVPMDKQEQSKGVYVAFESFGAKLIAYISYLPAERTEAGTTDLYSPDVGYATFDFVDSMPENLTQLHEQDFVEAMNEVSMPTTLSR